jgi:peptidoglycan L-alanyl-D-glutamate endopeptidase CwlK
MPSQYNVAGSLEPDVALRAYSLIYWLQHFGARTKVTEGLRTAERQAFLYASGRTRSGPILTQAQVSKHQDVRFSPPGGRAFDIDFVGIAAGAVPQEWWDFAGRIGEALGLRWGGRFTTLRDYRHFERRPQLPVA